MVDFETPFIVLPGKNCSDCCIGPNGSFDWVICDNSFDPNSSTTFKYVTRPEGELDEILVNNSLAYGFWGNDTIVLEIVLDYEQRKIRLDDV